MSDTTATTASMSAEAAEAATAQAAALLGRLGDVEFWYLALDRFIYYFEMGGWIMPPLVLSLFLLWYALGYRMAALKRPDKRDARLLIERYMEGRWRGKPRGITQQAIARGVAMWREQRPHLRAALNDAFGEYDGDLKRHVILINTIVAVAPLMGLLGTVTGMIETFDSLQDQALFSQSGGIAGGISQALLTTQFGLAVAIPGLVVKGMLKRRQQSIELELDQIKDILCSTPHPLAQEDKPA